MSEREIFLAVLDLPAAARAEYLDKVCGADAALRNRVDALLDSHERAGSFLGTPAVAPHGPDSAATRTIDPNGGEVGTDDEIPLGFLASATRPDSLGRIGHYEVLQVLGQGGFGIVFRAFDDVLHRVVAVKVLSPQMAATSPARKRFLREARSSAQVRHANVVQVYEVGEQPLPYIVMEFIPGETLQQRLNRVGPVEPAEVVRIGRQIAEGLAAAHATDLIHRDIKPGNVLLEGGAQRVKITDFGLARAADDASISQSGIIAGTPMYMAPEQAKGEPLDQRADLFSLGSVLYQMAAGRSPFRATGTAAVLKRVAEDAPRGIREIIPETPQWLCDIIAKLHAKNPGDRFQSAREVADVLADCEAQLKANARLKDFSRIPRGKPLRSGRRKWVAAAAVLLPVVALAVTEFAGVTHLFHGRPATADATNSGNEPTPGQVAKTETPVPAAKQEPLPPTFTNGVGIEFVIVPKGTSWLGGGKNELGDKVEIPADFYLGKYEVTQEEWEKVTGENPSHFSRNGVGKDAVKDISDADLKRFPVENVTWDQCQLFVAKLNKLEKETGWVYRLPTEAEWEYACRGGPMTYRADSAFDFYFVEPTNTLLLEQANFSPAGDGKGGLARTCKVGSYKPNKLGLFDMHGNVWQWCADLRDPNARGPGASDRVGRGGGWRDSGVGCLAAYRYGLPASVLSYALGLRLARAPVGAPSPEAETPPLAVAPFTDAAVRRIAALPAEEQVEEVRKELMRRNPGFDGKVEHKIADGVVTEFRIVTDQVTDIAPIRVFKALRVLSCCGTYTDRPNGTLADLTPLGRMNLAGLEHLDLDNTKVGDAGLASFKDCKNLLELHLWNTKASDVGLVNFQGCKSLTFLALADTRVSDAGLANFKDCKNLTVLGLNGTRVSDAGLIYFRDCKTLKVLQVAGTQVSDANLTNLRGMRLTKLNIDNTGLTDLTPLQGMPLEEIYLTPKNITQGLDILRDMKSLKTIGIGWQQAWPAAEFWQRYDRGEFKAADAFGADRKAAEYVLSVGGVVKLNGAEKDIKAAADLPREAFRLTYVDLGREANRGVVRDADLAVFTDCTNLTHFELWGREVTDAGLAHFKGCQGLTVLGLMNMPISDAGLAHFGGCKNLTHLCLSGTRVTDAGLAAFRESKGLRHLNLGGSRVSDAGLAYFRGCGSLSYLGLFNTQVADAGLAHFKDCRKLTELNLAGTMLTDAGLAHFKDCTGVSILVLCRTPVTDAGLVSLAGLNQLAGLDLADTKVTAEGVTDLAKALPKCKITWDGGVIEPK